MHLRVIIPLLGEEFVPLVHEEVGAYALPTTNVSVVTLERGTASIESAYDEALAAPGILDRVTEAAADGVDAVFVSCFGDPGVHAAREIVDLPVVGGFEPAMLTAMSLGDRVGVITVVPNVLSMLRGLARVYGITDRIGSLRYVDMPVLDLGAHDELIDRLEAQAIEALQKDEADVFVLGCTGMLTVAGSLAERLRAQGYDVPVVDPTAAAVTWLESSVRMRLRPSRTAYMRPAEKARTV